MGIPLIDLTGDSSFPNPSGFKGKTGNPFPAYLENPKNISSLNLRQNKRRRRVPLAPPPPSRMNQAALLIGSPAAIPRHILFEMELEYELKYGLGKLYPNIDMKILRRIVSNRISAQIVRMKTAQRTLDLEKEMAEYRVIIATLTPQVERYKLNKTLLLLENDSLQKRIDLLSYQQNLKQMEYNSMLLEKERLKKLENAAKWPMQQLYQNPFPEPDPNTMLKVQQYPTLSFYEESRKNLEISCALKKLLEDPDELPTFGSKETVADVAVEGNLLQEMEEDIDQYLNYDDDDEVMNFEFEEVNLDELDFF